jgi:DMSO/TMAO reductase YedYZ heme-binding membrane subunit
MLQFIIRLIISFLPSIPLYYLAKELLWNDIQIFWFLSFYYLIFALSVTPVFKIWLSIKRFKKYSIKIFNYRRPIGILAGIFSFLHIINFEKNIRNMWTRFYSDDMNYFSFLFDRIFWWWGESVFGMHFYAFWIWITWFIIMVFLLITSNNISQKIMWAKFWKYLHKLVYPLFIIILLHIYFIWWWKGLYLYPWLFLIILRLYVWFDEKYKRR